jgi:hypothetical protein
MGDTHAIIERILDFGRAQAALTGAAPRHCYVGATVYRMLRRARGAPVFLHGMHIHPRFAFDDRTILCTVEAQP